MTDSIEEIKNEKRIPLCVSACFSFFFFIMDDFFYDLCWMKNAITTNIEHSISGHIALDFDQRKIREDIRSEVSSNNP